jgi:hypothetical protein
LHKYLKYTIRGVAILVGVFLVLYIVAYIYVSVNKKAIIIQVTEQISEKLDGTVTIGNVDLSFLRTFPQISVLLEKVAIKDTMYSTHKHPFFTAEKLYARISVFQVIAKKDPLTGIRVDNGNLYIYTDTAGYTNNYLLAGKKKPVATRPTAAKKIILDDIRLNNFHITMDNRKVNKLLDFDVEKLVCDIRDRDSTLRFRTKNQVLIKSLAFNLNKGSYVKGHTFEGNFDLYYNLRNQQLYFDNIPVTIGNHPFNLTGKFNLTKTPDFSLTVNTKKLDIKLGRSFLPQKVAMAISIVSLDKPIDVKAVITGPLTPGEPLVNVDWVSSEKNTVTTPFFAFHNCTFTGGYTNELIPGLPRKDPNSRIRIHNFSGDYEGIPLRSDNIYIDDLVFPMINLDLKSAFSLTTLNNVLQNNSLKLSEGNADLNVTYTGPLAKNSTANTFINGTLKIKDGLLLYTPRNIALKNCNGSIVFQNTDVIVKDISTNVQGNSIVMNGTIKNLPSLIKTNPGKITLDWNVYSPELNLATLTSLLKKRSKVASANVGTGKLTRTASRIDDMLEQSNVQLDLKADKLIYKKFTASNVKASIGMVQDSWNLNNVSLQSGGGAMQIKGYIREKNAQSQEVKVAVNIDNADVNKIMYAFNDFGQDGISYKNLAGRLSSDIDVKMDIDRDLTGTPSNMEGVVNLSLKNGALLDYEPIKKLQNFLFKNRNFEQIKFAELKDKLEIKNGDITINRMEIQSTALTLFVEGIYSMKGNTDLSIQVPLSNLKKRDETYKPENVGADAKGGTSVYVRGRPGDDGNIKFKYDLFKKFRKDKSEKEKEAKKTAGDDR